MQRRVLAAFVIIQCSLHFGWLSVFCVPVKRCVRPLRFVSRRYSSVLTAKTVVGFLNYLYFLFVLSASYLGGCLINLYCKSVTCLVFAIFVQLGIVHGSNVCASPFEWSYLFMELFSALSDCSSFEPLLTRLSNRAVGVPIP